MHLKITGSSASAMAKCIITSVNIFEELVFNMILKNCLFTFDELYLIYI
jgi:hypothetical protein